MSPKPSSLPSSLQWLLRVSCAIMLVGHGWVAWNGHLPVRALLWNEELMRGIVASLFNTDWNTWVSSFEIGDRIDAGVRIQAVILFAFAASALIPINKHGFPYIYLLATANLVLLSWLRYLEAGVGLGQFLEYASQIATPFILFVSLRNRRPLLIVVILAALALTFCSHGVFAIGYQSGTPWFNHPRPGGFTEMLMLCLGLETESTANRLLLLGGILDLVAVVAVFIKGRTASLGLTYMILWGFLTALARPWAYFDAANTADSLNTWVPEALLRIPHFALPLYVLLALRINATKNPTPELVSSELPCPTSNDSSS